MAPTPGAGRGAGHEHRLPAAGRRAGCRSLPRARPWARPPRLRRQLSPSAARDTSATAMPLLDDSRRLRSSRLGRTRGRGGADPAWSGSPAMPPVSGRRRGLGVRGATRPGSQARADVASGRREPVGRLRAHGRDSDARRRRVGRARPAPHRRPDRPRARSLRRCRARVRRVRRSRRMAAAERRRRRRARAADRAREPRASRSASARSRGPVPRRARSRRAGAGHDRPGRVLAWIAAASRPPGRVGRRRSVAAGAPP